MKKATMFLIGALSFSACIQSSKTGNTAIQTDSITAGPKSQAAQPDRFRDKFEQGIDFIASGTEPFWSLEIDFDKSMHFKTPGGTEILTPAVEGEKAMDANVTRYSAQTSQGTLTVQIMQSECINDMSGEKFRYTVTIDTKKNADKDYALFKGCGQYLSDYRLHDIWALDSADGKKINQADFMKGSPRLEFNLTEQKVFGNTGCNSLTGSMEARGEKIVFGRLASTRMACNNGAFEHEYLQRLDNKTVSYIIRPGKLYLQTGKDSVYIYRKID